MPDNALALIQAKIETIQEKLNALRATEKELEKLSRRGTRRSTAPAPAKRSKALPAPAINGAKQTVSGRIRDYLDSNGPVSVKAIKEALDLDGRPVSFALQALKRAGKAKNVGGEWSIKGRRKAS